MGARTYWRAPLPPLGYSDGPTASGAGTLTDISPVPPVTIPPIWELGTRLHVKAFGWQTTTVAGTITFGLYLCGITVLIASGTLIAASPAVTPIVLTSAPWWLELEAEVRALSTVAGGATGSLELQGMLHMPASLTQMQAPYCIPATFAAKTVAFNSQVPQNLQISATTSVTTSQVACNHLDVALSG